MLALDLVLGMTVLLLWAGNGASTSAEAMYSDAVYMALALTLGTMTTAVGGAMCARWAPVQPYWNAAAFGAVSVVAGLLLSDANQPGWFTFLACLLSIPAAIYGARMYLRRHTSKPV